MKLTVANLKKSYGWTRVLRDVSFEVEPGQILVVLGLNGAGKTTLLRCLAGLTVPDGGQILYDNEKFTRQRIDLRRRLHFLGDMPSLFANPVRHIGMALEMYERDDEERAERVVELLREFDLLEKENALLGSLSRGQAYKVGLVTLLAIDPELWLLDEPMASGMDPLGLLSFKRHARAAAARGRIVIYSTQILEIAENFADLVCVIDDGRLRAFEHVERLRSLSSGGGSALEELFKKLRDEP